MSKIFIFLSNSQYKKFFEVCCKNNIDIIFNITDKNIRDRVEFFSQDLSDKYISSQLKEEMPFHISIDLTSILNYLQKETWKTYCNIESFFLNDAIKSACNPSINTIIVGSSYAKYGIDPTYMHTPAINFGLTSQDIYYSFSIARKIIKSNKNIKNVVFPTGYYIFHSDLSRATSSSAKEVVAATYIRALGDAHHAINLPKIKMHLPEHLCFLDPEKTFAYLCHEEFQRREGKSAHLMRTFLEPAQKTQNIPWKELYNFPRTEDERVQLYSSQKQYFWEQLSADARMLLGYQRAREHNKLYAYTETEAENKKLFDKFVTFCNKNGVNLYVLLMPQTDEYIRWLNPAFRSHYFQILDSIKGSFYFINYLNTTLFKLNDFADADHLNEQGAEKVSKILNDILIFNKSSHLKIIKYHENNCDSNQK